jgi:hypothetical protein
VSSEIWINHHQGYPYSWMLFYPWNVHDFLKKVKEYVVQSVLWWTLSQCSENLLKTWEGLLVFSMVPFNLLRVCSIIP